MDYSVTSLEDHFKNLVLPLFPSTIPNDTTFQSNTLRKQLDINSYMKSIHLTFAKGNHSVPVHKKHRLTKYKKLLKKIQRQKLRELRKVRRRNARRLLKESKLNSHQNRTKTNNFRNNSIPTSTTVSIVTKTKQTSSSSPGNFSTVVHTNRTTLATLHPGLQSWSQTRLTTESAITLKPSRKRIIGRSRYYLIPGVIITNRNGANFELVSPHTLISGIVSHH